MVIGPTFLTWKYILHISGTDTPLERFEKTVATKHTNILNMYFVRQIYIFENIVAKKPTFLQNIG